MSSYPFQIKERKPFNGEFQFTVGFYTQDLNIKFVAYVTM